MAKQIIQCHSTERVVSRDGVQHKAREIIYSDYQDATAKTVCRKFIPVPKMGKSPAVKKACKTCYGG